LWPFQIFEIQSLFVPPILHALQRSVPTKSCGWLELLCPTESPARESSAHILLFHENHSSCSLRLRSYFRMGLFV